MAIYHLSVKPVSRAGGRSATAAAAYRAGEVVHDQTTGQTFDYSRKRGVEHAEIVLPTEAARRDINWARDREALWNEAEGCENRSNSRVAREYEIALPHELSPSERLELVREFAAEIANRHGVAVDFAIHAPHREGDDRNHHAHLLATTRVIEPGGLGEKATIEWSDTNRRKADLEPARKEIEAIRERWADLANERLQERGLEIRIDHRSLEAQGIDREPTTHLGPAVTGLVRRGEPSEVLERIDVERASRQLELAAAFGRIERESRALASSILDVSGDLASAKRERDLAQRPGRAADQESPTPARSFADYLKDAEERLTREGEARAEALGQSVEWHAPGEHRASPGQPAVAEPSSGSSFADSLRAAEERLAAESTSRQQDLDAQRAHELEQRQRAEAGRLARDVIPKREVQQKEEQLREQVQNRERDLEREQEPKQERELDPSNRQSERDLDLDR